MRNRPFFKTILIFGLLFLITYALAEGIQYGSILGTALAIASLSALVFAIYLFRKLSQLKEEEENVNDAARP